MNPVTQRVFCLFLILSAAGSPQGFSAKGIQSTRSSLNSPGPAGSYPGVISIWGGARDTIALKFDGTVWTWGMNNCDPNNGSGQLGVGDCGKLGDGTLTSRNTPVQVHGPGGAGFLTSITAIMGGEHDNYALKSDGTVWAWGANFVGQLGDGTYVNSVTPVRVSGLTSVTMLGGRGYHNLAVKSDGTIWAWGWNSRGQLGHDTSASPCPKVKGTCSNVPVQVTGIAHPLAVTGGGFFSLALMPDHTAMGWGENNLGELGDGSATDRPAPVPVKNLNAIQQISAGWFHAVALKSDGTVWTWGDNSNGEIGNGTMSSSGVMIPFQVPGLANMVAVSAGDGYTAALKADGTVWTWGGNEFGQLGYDTSQAPCLNITFKKGCNSVPAQVPGLSGVVRLAARDYHTLAIKGDGSVWAWGSGANGELGNAQTFDQIQPVRALFPGQAEFLPLVLR